MPNGSAVPRRLGFLSAVASSSSGIDQPLAANSSQASGPTRVILAPVVLQRVVTDLATWLELGSSCERPSAVVALERAGMEQPQSNGLQVTINKSHVRYYLARSLSQPAPTLTLPGARDASIDGDWGRKARILPSYIPDVPEIKMSREPWV